MFTYTVVHGDAPKYLCDLVCPYTPTRVLRSANNNMLTVQRTHVKAGDCSFTVAAATLWNTLPIDIKRSYTPSTFKARLKTHFYKLSKFYILVPALIELCYNVFTFFVSIAVSCN